MEKIVNEKFGCQIIEKNDKLFIRFDEGEIVVKFVEYEITRDEAEEAMKSESEAYAVCLRAQSRNKH